MHADQVAVAGTKTPISETPKPVETAPAAPKVPTVTERMDAATADVREQIRAGQAPQPTDVAKKHNLSSVGAETVISDAYRAISKEKKTAPTLPAMKDGEVFHSTPPPDLTKPVSEMTWEEAQLSGKAEEWQAAQRKPRRTGGRMGRQTGAVSLDPLVSAARAVQEANRRNRIEVDFTKTHPTLARTFDRLRNAVVSSRGLAFTHRLAPKTFDSIIAYDQSFTLTDVHMRDTVNPVFKGVSPAEQARFSGMILADRILALRDNLLKAKADAQAAGTPAIEAAADAGLKKIEHWFKDDSGKPIDLDKIVSDYFAQPDIAVVANRYRTKVMPLLEGYRAEAGHTAMTGNGKHSALYFPGEVVGEVPGVGGGRPLTRKMLTLAKVPGIQTFEGTAKGYNLNPSEVLRNRLTGLTRAASMRTMFRNMFAEGIARDPIQPFAKVTDARGQVRILHRDTTSGDFYQRTKSGTMGRVTEHQASSWIVRSRKAGTLVENPDFKMFDGTMIVTGNPKAAASVAPIRDWGVSEAEMQRLGLPDRAIIPNGALKEMKPAFDKALEERDMWRESVGQIVSYYLTGTGEAFAHGTTLAGRLASVGVDAKTGVRPLDAVMNSNPLTKALGNIPRLFKLGEYTPEVREAAQAMAAKAGVSREFMEFDIRTPGKRTPSAFFGRLLYAEKGAFNNAVAAVYKFGKDTGMSDSEIMETMRALNAHNRLLRSGIEKTLTPLGMGTFYRTGSTSRFVGFERGLVPKTLVKSFLATTAISMMFSKDHKPWFMRKGGKSGDVVIGFDDRGYPVILNVAGINRPQKYAEDFINRVVSGVTSGKNSQQILGDVLAGAFNVVATPAATGPIGGIASEGTGHALGYWVPTTGELLPWPMDLHRETETSGQKGLEFIKAVLPSTRTVIGEESGRQTVPQGAGFTWLNRGLSMLGQTPAKAEVPRQQPQDIAQELHNKAMYYLKKAGEIANPRDRAIWAIQQSLARYPFTEREKQERIRKMLPKMEAYERKMQPYREKQRKFFVLKKQERQKQEEKQGILKSDGRYNLP